jgi:hypothetical protein
MKLKICYHGNCFDGVSSASVFSRFYDEKIHPGWEHAFQPMMHRAGALFDTGVFDGDENAIVDFKYSPSPELTWWFDHHQSAFLSTEDEAHYRKDKGGRKFLDSSYKSCTKFIADTAARKFNFDPSPMRELIDWANIIDGALYESAAEAVEMKAPALKLALVIESARDQELIERIIRDLRVQSPQKLVATPYVAECIAPFYQRHLETLEIIRKEARLQGRVIYFDVTGYDMEGYSKFIPYYLFPEAVYSVSVSHSTFRSKVSVGSNPWAREPRQHDLAQICERYGGGGHAVVAAISLAPDALDDARRIAKEIVQELNQ